MQLDRPPDRLGRPPNCRWIMHVDRPIRHRRKSLICNVIQSLKRLEDERPLTVIEVYRDQ